MTRRKWIILGVLIVLLTIGAELLVRPWNSSKGCVQVDNQGDAAMDDLVLSYGETKVSVGRLGAGQSTNVWFTAGGKDTLSLEFNQKGNPMKGFQVREFDPAENLANGLKLVLVVKNDRVERSMEDDQSTTPLKSLMESVSGFFELDSRPSVDREGGGFGFASAPRKPCRSRSGSLSRSPSPSRWSEQLVRLQAELAPEVPGCRWTSALPFHLTLAFLGDVPNRDLSAICQAAASSAGVDRAV